MAKTEAIYTGAYIVRGGATTLDALIDHLEKEKVIERKSPDLFARTYRAFGVSEAEELRDRARSRPVAGDRRVFALFVPGITTEAQNALLKTLEEPVANAAFFLITPAPETLLSTIRSRSQMLVLVGVADSATLVDVSEFLAAPFDERITMLKPLYDTEDEGRDIGGVIAFLSALERRFATAARNPGWERALKSIYRARKYATDKGSLLKSLLEQVALLSPKL